MRFLGADQVSRQVFLLGRDQLQVSLQVGLLGEELGARFFCEADLPF
ncbi:MAG: hypothetical protein JJE39_16250 [Vicinamibacteria bacterium]|nr:hypothetical protein [Vicinamibacteria bacterium]